MIRETTQISMDAFGGQGAYERNTHEGDKGTKNEPVSLAVLSGTTLGSDAVSDNSPKNLKDMHKGSHRTSNGE